MTLTSTTNRSSHTGNNSTTAFSYSFKVFDQSEIDVYLDGVKKTITTHYTVSGVGADAGGTVTFESDTVPGSGVAIVFVRNIAQTQTTDYTVTGQINPQTIEDALDKITMRNQKVQLNADESFGFADSVTDAGTVRISATSANRASKLLAFDSSGNLNADQEIGTSKGNWAASTAYVVRDIIKDTSNNNIYICLTAHTSSGSQPISSNTDSAKWRLLVDAASATTSQTAAAASATAAASSATAAASSASAASTSATNSASSATTSSTQASNSASSATSSASSATSSSTSATSSSNYATKVDGAVTGTDYSAKAWAVGGTGVTDTSSRGAAKEWATAAEDDQVDGSEYSAKHYATKASASATSAASSAAGMEAATIKDGTYWGYTTAGSANTYTLTTSPVITSYAADMFYHIKVNASNTGASTINVDSVGAKNIKKYGGAGMVDLASNDLESGGVYTIIYDGTQFLLLGGSATDSQVDINTADIFMLNSRRLSDHSANVLNTVDGFVDDFQDGSTQNNTAINISGSTNIAHDNTSKYWQNTRGSAGQTTDTAYTTESNYTQQEWTTAIVGSSNATFTNSSATVTISSGTRPANCDNGRISQDGTNWYDIASRDSATQLTIGSNFGQSTVTGTYTIRMTEFSGGKVQLNTHTSAGTIITASSYTVESSAFSSPDSTVKVLLHLDSTNGDNTTWTDSIGTHSWSANGNANTSTAQKVFGATSLACDGAADWIQAGNHADFQVSNSGTWQFKWRQYFNAIDTSGTPVEIMGNGDASTSGWTINQFYNSGSPLLRFTYTKAGGGNQHCGWSWSPSTSTWYAICLSFDNGSVRAYIDGTEIGSVVTMEDDVDYSPVRALRIGLSYPGWANLNGYIDEFQLEVGGTADVTSNVITEPVTTVPTFATLKDVSVWSDMNSVAITDTPYDGAKTMTATGNAKIKTTDTMPATHTLETGNSSGLPAGVSCSASGGTCANLFDGTESSGSRWEDSGTKWIKVDFGSGNAKTSMRIKWWGWGDQSPKDYTFQGSNDDASYTTLLTVTGNTTYNSHVTDDFSNSTAYRYYKMNITATVGGSDQANFAQLYIYSSAAGATVSPKFNQMMSVSTGGDNYISTADHNDWNCDGNFAIDFWMNHRTLVSSGNIVLQFEDSSNYNHFSLSGTTDVEWKVRTGGGNHWAQASSSLGLSAGTWYHVALVRSGSNIYAYVAGNQVLTSSVTGTPANISGALQIGGDISAAAGGEMDGWIDEFRWSDSDRGWTGATITVPSSAHSTDSNTKLLLHMDGSNDSTTFTDSHYDTYHYYSVIHMPTGVSAYNDTNVKVVVWTGTVWKEVARYHSSAWQRNTNTADSTATTWTNATVNDMVHAISEAIENNTRLRMKEADVEGISDANWEAAGGLTMGTTVKVGMAVTMKSESTTGNPTTDLVQFNYDGANLQGTFKTRVFGGTNMPPLAGSAPSNIVLEVIDKQISGTPAYKVSRDGGSNYDTISSWDIEDTLADGTTVRLADVTMAATSGTSPLVSIEQSGTGQDYRLYSLGLKYK